MVVKTLKFQIRVLLFACSRFVHRVHELCVFLAGNYDIGGVCKKKHVKLKVLPQMLQRIPDTWVMVKKCLKSCDLPALKKAAWFEADR